MATELSGGSPLLATKLFIPGTRPTLVVRSHLLERLNESLNCPLTLVSAPAGFGKTTLVSTWARALTIPVAWLSLDEADNDPVRFFRYLIAALGHVDVRIGQDLRAILEASPLPPVDALIAGLINDLAARSSAFVLVLDDFHTIDDRDIHQMIQSLAAQPPPHLHLVLVTREDPLLPLVRLRARGQLVDVRAGDLRFSLQESFAFLNDVLDLPVQEIDVHQLDAHMEGWIAGLQLAALSIQHGYPATKLIADLSSGPAFIHSYLTEEVLRRVSPEVRSFLLETSVLTRLTGPLCDALTGRADGEAMLERLYSANLFVTALDERHEWFRYHALFADLLRHQLSREQPALVPTLHTRASAWYEHQGLAAEAIDHAFAAGDYARVARLLDTYAGTVVYQGYARTVEDWLRRLPDEWRAAGARASLAFGWSLLLRGQMDEIEPQLQAAEAAAQARMRLGAALEAEAIRAEILALRAMVASILGQTDRGCEFALEAMARAPRDNRHAQAITRFALGGAYHYAGRVSQAIDAYQEALPLCQAEGITAASRLAIANLALLYLLRGQLRDAAGLCRQVVEAAEQSGSAFAPDLATVTMNYGLVLIEWGELAAARSLAERWIEASQRGGHTAALVQGEVVLARLLQAEGDLTGAVAALDRADRLFGPGIPAWIRYREVYQRVVLALAQDDPAAAAQALARAGVSAEDPIDELRELLHIAALRLLLAQGRKASQGGSLEHALDLAGRLLASAEPAGRMGRVIEVLILRALANYAQGKANQALDDLSRALARAEPEGYLRLLVDEGAPMASLLRAARERRVPPAYVDRLLAALRKAEGGIPFGEASARMKYGSYSSELHPSSLILPPFGEPLTEREMEVLRLLAEDLTYQEIARRLVVSLNTVRFHVKSIYGKLAVEKRAAAVARARALELL